MYIHKKVDMVTPGYYKRTNIVKMAEILSGDIVEVLHNGFIGISGLFLLSLLPI